MTRILAPLAPLAIAKQRPAPWWRRVTALLRHDLARRMELRRRRHEIKAIEPDLPWLIRAEQARAEMALRLPSGQLANEVAKWIA